MGRSATLPYLGMSGTENGTPPAPVPSYRASSIGLASGSPVPRLIARSMLSFGTELPFAFSTAAASDGLPSRFPPPSRAATSTVRRSFAHSFERAASAAPFLRLIVAHLLCPLTRQSPLPQALALSSEALHE